MKLAASILGLALAVLAAPPAPAATEVLVCYPGGGNVKPRQARPAMEKMLAVLERLGGWSQGTFQHQFTSKVDECRKLIAEKKPAYLLTSLGLYLEHRQAQGLVPMVRPRMAEQQHEIYRILVKKGGPADLAGLKGKTLGGNLLDEPVFLKRIVFAGKIDPATHFQLEPSKRALRALRKLAKGQLDAVMVNAQQYRALSGLPFAKDLAPAFTSAKLPLLGLAASDKRTKPADRDRMAKAMAGLCADSKGKEICDLFGLQAFSAVKPGDYQTVIELWDAE